MCPGITLAFFYLSFYKHRLITEQIFEAEMMLLCYMGGKPLREPNFIVQKNQSHKIQKVFSFLALLKSITSKKKSTFFIFLLSEFTK